MEPKIFLRGAGSVKREVVFGGRGTYISGSRRPGLVRCSLQEELKPRRFAAGAFLLRVARLAFRCYIRVYTP